MKLTTTIQEDIRLQTEGLIQGLGVLRDALNECSDKKPEEMSCAEIEELLRSATHYLYSLATNERYERLRKGMIDFAQPIFQASRNGDASATKKKNLILDLLEREVARTYLPIRLLIALRFPFSEHAIATLEALRIVQAKLGPIDQGHYYKRFNYEEFSPRTLSEWLKEIPSSIRNDLWLDHFSSIDTLFLYVYRNDPTRARQGAQRWMSYREPPPAELYPRYEYDGGILFRFH